MILLLVKISAEAKITMTKTFLSFLLIVFTITPVFAANAEFRCERKHFSNINFKNSADLDNVYPKNLWIVIAENKSWAASYYGVQRNRSGAARKNDVIRTKNGVTIDRNKLRSTGEIFIMIKNQGFKSPIPATYQCGKGKKTSWKPAE